MVSHTMIAVLKWQHKLSINGRAKNSRKLVLDEGPDLCQKPARTNQNQLPSDYSTVSLQQTTMFCMHTDVLIDKFAKYGSKLKKKQPITERRTEVTNVEQ